MDRKRIKEALGIPAAPGEKAVAGFDEDSISMAAMAALDCINGIKPGELDAVYLATTSTPYKEKQSATTIAMAIDAGSNVRTADFTNSLRAGSTAILAAIDAVKAGAKNVLVTAADCRMGAPQGALEQVLGDGAAALVIGGNEVLAKVVDTYSVSKEFIDHWRDNNDTFVRPWEERFTVAEGYNKIVMETVKGIAKKTGLTPGDFAKIILYSLNPRHQMALAAAMGFQPAQIQDSLYMTVGSAGTANAPMMLAGALEEAKPGDKLLFVTYGDGSDAIVFEVTEAISNFKPVRGLKKHVDSKASTMTYGTYLKLRNLVTIDKSRQVERLSPYVPAMFRNYKQNLSLYGTICKACGTPQYPRQRVCVNCQAKDQMEDYRFADKKGKIATYTLDFLAPSDVPPTVLGAIDFEGGGRMLCEISDCDPAKLEIGMDVEMSFRRLYKVGSFSTYFWKARPIR